MSALNKKILMRVSARFNAEGQKRRRPRTVNLDDTIYDKARIQAAKMNTSLSALVEDLLDEYVKHCDKTDRQQPSDLISEEQIES